MPWSRHCCSSSAAPGIGGVLVDEHAVHVGQPAFDVGAGPHGLSLSAGPDPPTAPDRELLVTSERRAEGGRKRPRVEDVARKQAWDPEQLPDLSGRTYLVTGSNAGLGFFSTEQLVRAGARVYMTGRSPNRLMAARAALRRRNPDAADRVETLLLDTSNLGSVRAAAATIGGRGALDGLLLNAGIVHPPKERETTGDGNEVVFATNVLGHFALAGELLTTLARGIRSHGVAREHVDLDVEVRPGRPAAGRGLQRVARLRAVEGGDRGARLRSRPPPARGGRAGHERRRAPGVLDERPHARDRRREQPDQTHAVRRQPAVRDHAVQGARRVDRSCARSSIPTSRAASSGVRGAWPAASRAGAERRRSLAIPRSPTAVGRVRRRHRRAVAVRARRRAPTL